MTEETQATIPSTASIGRGAMWLIEGLDYFSRDALAWIGMTILAIILSILLSFIPVINFLTQIIFPVFVGGLMFAVSEQDQDRGLSPSHLFAGFSNNTGQLILVGILYFIGCIIVFLIFLVLAIVLMGGTEILAQFQSADHDAILANIVNVTIALLIALALYIPLLMCIWFAPALVILDNHEAINAMKLSFKGCLLNVIPLLVYGVIGLVFSIIATIPLLLGWLILIPMMIASIYISYKDIFKTNNRQLGHNNAP